MTKLGYLLRRWLNLPIVKDPRIARNIMRKDHPELCYLPDGPILDIINKRLQGKEVSIRFAKPYVFVDGRAYRLPDTGHTDTHTVSNF